MTYLEQAAEVRTMLLEHMIRGQQSLIDDAKQQIEKYPDSETVRDIYQSRLSQCEYALGVMQSWLEFTKSL